MKAGIFILLAILCHFCSWCQFAAREQLIRNNDTVHFKGKVFQWRTLQIDTFDIEDPMTGVVEKYIFPYNCIIRCNDRPVEDIAIKDNQQDFTGYKDTAIYQIYENINKALRHQPSVIIRDLHMNFIITNLVINTKGQIIYYEVYTDKTMHSTHSFYLDPERTGLNKIPELNNAIDQILSQDTLINPQKITFKQYYFSSRRFNPFYFPD